MSSVFDVDAANMFLYPHFIKIVEETHPSSVGGRNRLK